MSIVSRNINAAIIPVVLRLRDDLVNLIVDDLCSPIYRRQAKVSILSARCVCKGESPQFLMSGCLLQPA